MDNNDNNAGASQGNQQRKRQAKRSTGGLAPRKMAFLEKPKDPRQIRYERNVERGRIAESGTQTKVETRESDQQTYASSSDAQTQTRDPARTTTTGAQTLLTVRNPDAFHD